MAWGDCIGSVQQKQRGAQQQQGLPDKGIYLHWRLEIRNTLLKQ
jgi:hypothetical protein